MPAKRAAKVLRGAARTGVVGPASTMRPASSTTTRSARVTTSSRSCVTSTVDRPSRVRTWRSTRRIAAAAPTSRPASGSSSSRTSGSAARARASATRCAWPPESWRGRRPARSAAPTSPSHRSAVARTSLLDKDFRLRAPKATLAATDRWGNSRASCMSRPTRRSWVATCLPVDVSVSTRSPTRTEPSVGRTRPATTCSTVDLPAPLGPRSASTSPGATVNETSSPRLGRTTRSSTPLIRYCQPLAPPALMRRLPRPTTTTAATATRSTDRATAARASTSRCR